MKDLERALRHPQAATDLNHRQRTGTDGSRRTRAAGGGARGDLVGRAGDLGRNPSRDVSPDDAPCAGRQGSGPWDRHGNHRATSAQKAAPGQRF